MSYRKMREFIELISVAPVKDAEGFATIGDTVLANLRAYVTAQRTGRTGRYSGYCEPRDLPPDYGNWNTVQRCFCRWRDKGIGEKILEALIDEPDYEWLMIDGISAEWLLADRGYDTDKIIDKAASQEMRIVIPPKKTRKQQRSYDTWSKMLFWL